MLSHWLNHASPPLTMAALHRALVSPVIGRKDLVGDIETVTESDTAQSEGEISEY